MIKKLTLVFIMAAFVMGGAFAQFGMSAGIGAFYGTDFGSGIEATVSGVNIAFEMPHSGIGFFGFVDIGSVEVSAGYFSSKGDWAVSATGGGLSSSNSMGEVSFTSINVGLLLKYPLAMGGFTVFPAAGIEYYYLLSAQSGSTTYTDHEKISQLWIKAGAGLDIMMSNSMYIRATALYGIKMPNELEKELVNKHPDFKPRMGHGFTIKLGIGFSI